jgi:hypothetical protein
MTTDATELKRFVLQACHREACSRVCKAHLALLRTYFTQYRPRARGPYDQSAIERVTQDYHKEDRRRERILIALNRHAREDDQAA